MNITGQIAFDPAAFIVVGTATFFLEFSADFEAIEKELAHIVPDAFKVFDKLLIIRHDIAFL